MGLSDKPFQMEGGVEAEARKRVIDGIPLRSQLKPVFTKPPEKGPAADKEAEEECSTTTPTAEEARIPSRLPCPPAPRKRKPCPRWHYDGGDREFFPAPDLETVFIRRVERA